MSQPPTLPPVPPGLTPARLAAKIAVEFCVPIMTGGIRGQSPVQGHALTPEARAQLGVTATEGATVLYPLGQDSVLLDMTGPRSTIWFVGADAIQAEPLVDSALRGAYPNIRIVGDDPNPHAANTRTRGYTLELGDGKVAMLEMGYPLMNAASEDLVFVLRITAMQRPPGVAPSTRGAAQADDAKKKGWF